MHVNFILTLIFFNSLLNSGQASSKSDSKKIDHCLEYNTGENSDSCSICEDKYFQFFNNLFCLPCNDTTYGQIGCEGKCDGTNYKKTRNVFCEEDGCKEGYFNLNGVCMTCSEISSGCSKCVKEETSNVENRNFKCTECLNDEYFLDQYDGCEKCKLPNCKKCLYNKDRGLVECDICEENYYRNSDGKCTECYYVYIYGGYCKVCSENETEYHSCSCYDYSGYTKNGSDSCIDCQEGCSECKYDNKTKSTECINCYSNYVFDSDKNCIYCGNECTECELDEKNNPICKNCYSGTFFGENECLICPSGCEKCILDNNNVTICTECYSNWGLNTENNTCTYCGEISETGEGCDRCVYNKDKMKYECLECYYYNYDYTYINNIFQCKDSSSNQSYIHGCRIANYNETTKKYECLDCWYDFTMVKNERRCINVSEENLSQYCSEIENINTSEDPLFSCTKCYDNISYILLDSNKVKNCYERNINLTYCLEGKFENGNYICTKCTENASLNKENICECNLGFFGKDLVCYECDDKNYGNPGCNSEKGCKYFPANEN